MTPAETALLLSHAETLERRAKPTDPDVFAAQVAAWSAKLAPLRFEDAWAAMDEHFAEQSSWLMPADVIARVAAMREQWMMGHAGTEIPPGCGRPAAIPPHVERERARAIEAAR